MRFILTVFEKTGRVVRPDSCKYMIYFLNDKASSENIIKKNFFVPDRISEPRKGHGNLPTKLRNRGKGLATFRRNCGASQGSWKGSDKIAEPRQGSCNLPTEFQSRGKGHGSVPTKLRDCGKGYASIPQPVPESAKISGLGEAPAQKSYFRPRDRLSTSYQGRDLFVALLMR